MVMVHSCKNKACPVTDLYQGFDQMRDLEVQKYKKAQEKVVQFEGLKLKLLSGNTIPSKVI